ncbi:MAG: hypothetical protein ACI9L9_001389, partial [Marivirga sp.]
QYSSSLKNLIFQTQCPLRETLIEWRGLLEETLLTLQKETLIGAAIVMASETWPSPLKNNF